MLAIGSPKDFMYFPNRAFLAAAHCSAKSGNRIEMLQRGGNVLISAAWAHQSS